MQELMVTNIGEVPKIGKPLVTIAPDGESLFAEALLLNRDAGFVRARMEVIIKLEAYPFTRYGVPRGQVLHVSPDATADQQRELVFLMRVRLRKTGLDIEEQPAALSLGMAVTAEVVTGSRRVVDYLWSPVACAVYEAVRVR